MIDAEAAVERRFEHLILVEHGPSPDQAVHAVFGSLLTRHGAWNEAVVV